MGKRILVAVVGIPLLVLVLSAAPAWATLVLTAALCAVGAYELLHALHGERAKGLEPLTVAVAALVPLGVYAESYQVQLLSLTAAPSAPLTGLLAMLFVLLLFVITIVRYGSPRAVSFELVTAAIFAGLVFPLMLSCLLRLRMMEYGFLLVWAPLAVSFGSDTCALFAGMACGKHKLAPLVSPHKTVEGAVGGLLGGVLGLLILRAFAARFGGMTLWTIPEVFCFGVLGSLVSQIGDLSFSAIKREYGIKDYGNLLPGHGGVLDRFDSVTFVTPFVWFFLSLYTF